MPRMPSALGFMLVFIVAAFALGQEQFHSDFAIDPKPEKLVPLPLSVEQQNHYKALKHFVRGQCLHREHRLPEALQAFEDALKLEPRAAAVCKELAALCFQLDRDQQAMEYCRKALDLDPDDHALWFRLGQELKERGRLEEAADAVSKAVAIPEAKANTAVLAQMLFDLGMLRERLQQYDKAAEALEQVAQLLDESEEALEESTHLQRKQIDAEAAKTYERLGHVELQAKHFEAAASAFRKAQAKDPERAGRLQFNLAEIYLTQRQPAIALDHLHRYLETRPPGAEAYTRLIEVLRELQRTKEILPALEKAAENDPFNQELRLLLARQYVEAGHTALAEKAFLAILEDHPSDEAYRGLAKICQQQNRWDELVQRLDEDFRDPRRLASARFQAQVLATEPALLQGVARAAHAQTQSGKQLTYQVRRVLAGLCRQARLYDLAEAFCRLCLADDPQPGDAYLELCRILSDAEKPEAEVAVCREALTKTLKVPSLFFQLELARALSFTDKTKEALSAAQEAVRQTQADTPERLQAEFNLVAVYYRCAELDKAADVAEKLLDQSRDTRDERQVRHLLSGIYSAKHDATRSEVHLQKLLESDPNDAVACNDLGYQWAEQGKNLEKAEELIRKAIVLERADRKARNARLNAATDGPDTNEANSDNAAYIDSLGWVLFKRGKPEEALRELERAAKLKTGDDPVIWEHLGNVYHHLGQADKARTAWRKAIELYDKTKRVGLDDHRQEVLNKLKQDK